MSEQPVTQDLPPLPTPERLQELLHDAARLGRSDVIPALLQAGATLEGRDANGHTPLILASYHGHAAATGLLLAAGADPCGQDTGRGNTALMGVAFKGHEALARLLVDASAEVDQRNHAGQTALMNAAMFGHMAIVDLLLESNSDPLAMDAAGNSAASVAQAQDNKAMMRRIEEAVRQRGTAIT